MKKAFFASILIAAAYALGLVHGDMASRTKRITVDMTRRVNQGRLGAENGEYTRGRAEDGREVLLIWHR